MGWEVWHDENNEYGNYRIGFWCNNSDTSFGPVLKVHSSFEKKVFYELWDKAFIDPRSMTPDDLDESARWIVRVVDDYNDIATANLKIFKINPHSAPYLIHEDTIVSSYDMLEFSPYKEALENLSTEDEWEDFDAVHDIVEQLNEDMKSELLHRNEKMTSWNENLRYGYRGEISWKVLDE